MEKSCAEPLQTTVLNQPKSFFSQTKPETQKIMASFLVWLYSQNEYSISFEEERYREGTQVFTKRVGFPTSIRVIDSRSSCPKWRLIALKKIEEFMQNPKCKESTELEISFCLGCDSIRVWKKNELGPCGMW